MHWHRSNFHDLSQRSLGVLLQWGHSPLSLGTLARFVQKSPEVTRLAMRPWEQQGIVNTRLDTPNMEPLYYLNTRHAATVQRHVKQALYEHAALGELYFAYGSNMNPQRLEARGIPPRFIARAHARGYILGFPRRMRDGGGVAGMLATREGVVEGALYLFNDEQFTILDRYEDAPRAYFRAPLLVTIAASPADQPIVPRLCVITYEAVPGTPAAPAADYLQHMIDGAKFWHLSPRAIRSLESITPLRDGGMSIGSRVGARNTRRSKRKKR